MVPPDEQSKGIPLADILFGWILPVVGGILSITIARLSGVPWGWALLIGVLGSFVFQWGVIGLLVLVAKLWGRWN